MTNVFNVTKKWSERLEAVGCDPNVGEQLVRHVLQYDYTGWIMALNEEVEGEALERMERLGARLLRGEPFQYVIEEAYFFNRPFYVDSSVLIPRPETEEIVAYTLEVIDNTCPPNARVVDIGTGSGAIAVTLKKERPALDIEATDISKDALLIAKQNATTYETALTFRHGDGTNVLSGTYDVIISNPPYIGLGEKDAMSESTKQFEPELALYAKEEGLAFYRHLAETIQPFMTKGSHCIVEIGYLQKESVLHLFQRSLPHAQIEAHQDMHGKDRWVHVTI